MEKNSSIIKDKRINRILEYNDDSKQITIGDQRFYQRKSKVFYPSVTYVLSYFPKGKFFEDWIKQVGFNSEIIVKKAGEEGTEAHDLIERFLQGEELVWITEQGKVNYNLIVWQMLLRFVDFWNTVKPKLIASEQHIFSDIHKFAGTIDLIVEIDGELWILDIKTSNSVHKSYDLQLAAYAQAWNETFDQKILKTGIIWLKSSSRKTDKSGKKIQGDGWALKVAENWEGNFDMFLKIYDIFKMENPLMVPMSEILPNIVKL
jgi:hypothetical protein